MELVPKHRMGALGTLLYIKMNNQINAESGWEVGS